MVIYKDNLNVMKKFMSPKENSIYMDHTLSKGVKEFGITSNDLGYRINSNGESILCSILNRDIALLAEVFESSGTMKFIHEFPTCT